MKKWIPVLLITLLTTTVMAEDGGWYSQDIWQNTDRAFQWYPDAQKKQQKQQQQQQQQQQSVGSRPNELVQFELLQKKLDESRKIAIMNPTEANLKQYIQLQELVMQQSALFTDQWQRVIWQNPQLDYSLQGRPTNQLAAQTYDQKHQVDKQAAIRQLAGQNGILFFYRSDCPYCHTMAPILRGFANIYGIKIMPVSLDGKPMKHFPNTLPNNGIAQKLAVQQVPALYIMDTQTKQFKPLGFGVMAQTTLEDRFLAYSRPIGSLY